MTDRIVVLKGSDPLSFLADACAALAASVNEPHAWSVTDEDTVRTYACLVRAYADALRPMFDGNDVQVRIVDHLLWRLGQAEQGEIVTSVLDIVDRLHAELVSAPALS